MMSADALAPLRILVVDDEDLVRDALMMLLRLDRHLVEGASNSSQALEMFQPGKFDLVITDYKMAGLKGDQLAAAIKALVPDQPILMFTGHAEAFWSDQNTPKHFDYLITKPCSRETLREAVAAVLLSKAPPRDPPKA
jgi:two-component system sensor histidine kinase EvgS